MTERNVDKREQILKTAIQLFAVKGSSSTSMQEIAELNGISKGSLYLVFKSKEELERSVYIYCFRMIRDPLLREEQENRRTPREKLRNQIEILLNNVYELREFLQRQIQELAGKGQSDVPDWLRKNNSTILDWFQNKLETLYGKEILPYTADLCMVASGMIHSYIRVIFQQGSPVSLTRMADHLVTLMDTIVAGLLTDRPEPLMSITSLYACLVEQEEGSRKNPLQLIKESKELLNASTSIEPQEKEELLESLAILEGEFLAPHPRKSIFKGMLLNLQGAPELEANLEELKKLIIPHTENFCSFH